MKKSITSHTELQQLVDDVFDRTPHAKPMHRTVKTMHDHISPKIDFQRDTVLWFYRNKAPSRSVWLTYFGETIYFVYNPRERTVEMRKDNRQGDPIKLFSAQDEPDEIREQLSKVLSKIAGDMTC